MLRHQCIHLVGVCDISFEKLVTIAMFLRNTIEIGEIARVGQDIDVRDRGRACNVANVANKVAADESTATGY